MTNLAQSLATALKKLDVEKDPRRVAVGATLLNDLQEHAERGARLEVQAKQFLAGDVVKTPNGHKSLADWAEEVLLDSDGPMRYREIAAEIRGRGFQHSHEPKNANQLADSVWSAMYEDSRKRFMKVGRGIWDLASRHKNGH